MTETKFAEVAKSFIGLMNKFRRKADNLAQGIRDHGNFQLHVQDLSDSILSYSKF